MGPSETANERRVRMPADLFREAPRLLSAEGERGAVGKPRTRGGHGCLRTSPVEAPRAARVRRGRRMRGSQIAPAR